MVVSSSFCVWKKKSVVSAPIYRPVRLTFFTLYFVVQIHISQTFTPSFQNKNFQSLIIYKNWMNFHIDRIMFTVSELEIKKVKIQVEHPVQKLSFSNFQRF